MTHVLAPLVWKRSPNFSSRHGQHVTHLTWHATVGHYGPSIAWLCDPRAEASAHLVLREDGGETTQLVKLAEKAWHAAAWNPFTVGVEHASLGRGFATQAQLEQSARLFAFLCHLYGIPPVHGLHKPSGIVRHRDLGSVGGDHVDGPTDKVWFGEFLPAVHHELTAGGFRKTYTR